MSQRNRTRKAGRGMTDEEAVFVVPPVPPLLEKMPYNWDKFVIEGDVLYEYMVHNYETMFDGKSIIKHFAIRPWFYGYYSECDDLLEQNNFDIQHNLIAWIDNERMTGRLFDKTNWKPFREQELFTCMYLGYKKMFPYNHCYLQLIIESRCGDCDYCKDSTSGKHFELALFSWEENATIQPYDTLVISSDNSMPERYWNRK